MSEASRQSSTAIMAGLPRSPVPTPSPSPGSQLNQTSVESLQQPFGASVGLGSLSLPILLTHSLNSDWSDTETVSLLTLDDGSLVSGGDDGSITFWEKCSDEKQTGISPSCYLKGPSSFPVVFLQSTKLPGRNGRSIVCLQSDGSLSILAERLSSFESVSLRLATAVGQVHAASVFGEGRYVAVLGKSASIQVIDLVTSSPVLLMHGHEDWVSGIATKDNSSSSSTLVSCSEDGMLHIWKWKLDDLASDVKRTRLRITSRQESSEEKEQDTEAVRYRLAFGNANLMVLTASGVCALVDVGQLELNESMQCPSTQLVSGVLESYIFSVQDGLDNVAVLTRSGEVLLFSGVSAMSGKVASSASRSVIYQLSPERNPLIRCLKCKTRCTRVCLSASSEPKIVVLTSTCAAESINIYRGENLDSSGRKARRAYESTKLSIVVSPMQPHFAIFPTIVISEVSDGRLAVSMLPDWPKDDLSDGAVDSKITALSCFPTWQWDEGKIRMVLVGRLSGRIDLYSLRVPHLHGETFLLPAMELVASVQANMCAIVGFSVAPDTLHSDDNARTFCSVGADNDIVVLTVLASPRNSKTTSETAASTSFKLECVFRLSGHHSSVRGVQWDTATGTLHARCDKTFVWSLLSGSLERRAANSLGASLRQASRGINLSTGAILFAHTPTSLVSGTLEGDVDPQGTISRPRRLEPSDLDANETTASLARPLEFPLKVPPPCERFGTTLELDVSELGEAVRMCFEKGKSDRVGYAYGGALSMLHEWGMDPELDRSCATRLGMRQVDSSRAQTRYFFRQRLSNGSSAIIVGGTRWGCSELLTAGQNLGMVALFLTMTTFQNVPMEVSETLSHLVTAYGIKFPDLLRQRGLWREPSLMFLAKQALMHEVRDELSSGSHVAARLLLQRTVDRMRSDQRNKFVSEWSARVVRLREGFQAVAMAQAAAEIKALPGSSNGMTANRSAMGALGPSQAKRQSTTELSALESDTAIIEEETPMDERLRSIIVSSREYQLLVLLLAVVGVGHPEDVSPVSARLVTETLVELISPKMPHRQAVIGQQSGLNANAILTNSATFFQNQLRQLQPPGARHIVSSNMQSVVADALSISSGFAAELLAKGFPLFRPHIPHMSRLIKKLLALASEGDDVPHRATAVDRALSEVGAAHPVLFVRTIGVEVLKKDVPDTYRRKTLEVLVNLVRSFPLVFLRHLPLVAEIVIRTLDPSEPALRNSVLQASTQALQELVKRYPMVSFHQTSQRFAVGTVESTIIIYDLRTATKWRVLDGTEGAVSAVAFEKDGERMASYCAHEHAVRIWAVRTPGLFAGLLTIRGTFLSSVQLPALKESFNEAAILKECRLEWSGPSELKLRRECGGQPEILTIAHV